MTAPRKPSTSSRLVTNQIHHAAAADLPQAERQPTAVKSAGNVILVVSPFEEDLLSLQQIFSGSNWILRGTRTCGEALALLRESRVSVIICESDLPNGDWKNMLEELAQAAAAPHLIVTSRLADQYLWAEVLNLGGYDVLEKPFDAQEVRRIVTLAQRHWENHRKRLDQNRRTLKAGA